MRRLDLLLLAVLSSTFLIAGCASTSTTVTSANQAATSEQKNIPQDPKLRITTQEVMELFTKEFSGSSLVPETLRENKTFQLIDARPAVKFEDGHVPGALNLPKPLLSKNLEKLDKDKMLIFYCGGLHCKQSSGSAEIAMKAGFQNVKVWYEGMPGWIDAGNYAEIETSSVEKLVMIPGKAPFLLIDARPGVKYQKSFIPSAVSLPKAEFEVKKGLLPSDKSLPLVFYCGGYKCKLSHKSAELALAMGYKKVSVYAAGEPGWNEAGLPLWGNEVSGVKTMEAAKNALSEAITPEEFTKMLAAGKLTVVDVRSKEEYDEAHIPGAIHVFDEDFYSNEEESLAKLPKEGRIVLYCSAGSRSGGAYYAILDTNYGNKSNLQYLDAIITINADGSFTIEKE
jgi:rhodanese-related sulfurtransferase